MTKRTLFAIAMITALHSAAVNAKAESVVYRCPSLNEVDSMGTRTSINKKTVNWEIKTSSNSGPYDKPIEFMHVVLKTKDSDSYDRSVSCVYRSKENKKYILEPMSSFHWYVDGAAEKTIGTYWHVASNGNFECSNSVKHCLFQFR